MMNQKLIGKLAIPYDVLPTITSRYGNRKKPIGFHTGIDIGTKDDRVLASHGGTITFDGYGNTGELYVAIKNEKLGVLTLYVHLDKEYVKVGQEVKMGALLGQEGSTGNVSGEHLHFTLKVRNSKGVYELANPEDYIDFTNTKYLPQNLNPKPPNMTLTQAQKDLLIAKINQTDGIDRQKHIDRVNSGEIDEVLKSYIDYLGRIDTDFADKKKIKEIVN